MGADRANGGDFDFTNCEATILATRTHGMKLVLLWFDSFKKVLSIYVPAWVRRDVQRFPRIHTVEVSMEIDDSLLSSLVHFQEIAEQQTLKHLDVDGASAKVQCATQYRGDGPGQK